MKTMALTGIREMRMIDSPAPQISNETDVLIKLTHMGICGSDLHLYSTGQIGDKLVKFPFVLGHEGCGMVEQVGTSVTRVRKGDLIAIEPAMPCGECDQCTADRPHTCRKLSFLGSPGQSDGLLSEYIVMPEECCHPLPEGMNSGLGCLAEPLSIGIYAVELAGSLEGKKIAIDYSMYKGDDGWRVYDVAIEGVSVVGNYRSQFNSILNKSSFAELIQKLKEKEKEFDEP